MLKIEAIPGAPIETNCYFVADTTMREAILIDAPWQVIEEIRKLKDEFNVNIKSIVLTHGHWDHIMGASELKEAFSGNVCIHENDVDLLRNPTFAPFSFNFKLIPLEPDRILRNNETITVGRYAFTVISTPGHTSGCICLYNEDDGIMFTGDTLFSGSYGRLDLGGDPAQMVVSLEYLASFDGNIAVYPGHGPDTILSREKVWLKNINEIIEDVF